MSRHQRSHSHDKRSRDYREARPRFDSRRSFRGGPSIEPQKILAALSKLPGGATASQIAVALSLKPTESRDIAQSLRKLVEQGQVLETRPGRYQSSGSGGEFSVIIEAATPTTLQARFPDDRVLPVHAHYSIGAKAGDIAQAVVGEDNQVLITRILRRSGREVVGTINFKPDGMAFIPDNRREGYMRVIGTYAGFEREYQAGDRVLATVEVSPAGEAGVRITRILGETSPEVTDFNYVCITHDLPGEFPPEVEEQARSFAPRLELGKREDLRKKQIFTIDPATAKDFDDAISLEPRPGGGWILGVHIADVSHYVRGGMPLDQEAAARGTSIYLINRVIPMLPEVLSNGLCSLVPNQDRYCLSAFLELDQRCKLIGSRLAETVIHSRHRLTYEQAMQILEKKDPPGQWPQDLKQTVIQVSAIAQSLRAHRERAGALNLYSVEHSFTLDVNGIPIEVGQEVSDISHQLIEECMLLANRAVAEWLERHEYPCVYRIHAPPDAPKLEQFAAILEAYGIDGTGVHDRFGLQRVLKSLEKESEAAQLVLNFMCLRSFKKAVYGVENIGHFALAFNSYAHFTSPIRRYPDLLVHRLVKRALALHGYEKVEMRRSYLDALAKQSSYLEQRAEGAERTLQARKSARYLSTRIGEIFPGVVTGATGGGLFVQLRETGMEGIVPVRELSDDFYEYDQERMALIGRSSGRVLGPGAEFDVQIASVDIERSDVTLGVPRVSSKRAKEGDGAKRDDRRDDRRGGKRDERRAVSEDRRKERKAKRQEKRKRRE